MKENRVVGCIGLGRMGLAITKKFRNARITVVGFDKSAATTAQAKKSGVRTVEDLEALAAALPKPAVYWLMVPIGVPVDETIEALAPVLKRGDVVIDGGNADFEDSIRRRAKLKTRGISFIACGTSGGISGAESGPPMTLDADPNIFKQVQWVFDALGGNYVAFSKPGRGHLAKTIHNAIEYGMIQSLAEGVSLYLAHGYTIPEIKKLFNTWSRGSIIESRLVNCLLDAFETIDFKGKTTIGFSETAHLVRKVLNVERKLPVLHKSLKLRKNAGEMDPVTLSTIAALRNTFGGHSTAALKK